MVRPKKQRLVSFEPGIIYFKPRGVPLSDLEEVDLTVDELEVLCLADFENLDQTEAVERMKVSQSTFQRILTSARKKTAKALVTGCAIKVKGSEFIMRGPGFGRGTGRGGGRGRMGGPFVAGPGRVY